MSRLAALIALGLAVSLAGCGKRGPLSLPDTAQLTPSSSTAPVSTER